MITSEQKSLYKKLLQERKQLHKKSSRQTIIFFILFLIIGIILGIAMAIYFIQSEQKGIFPEGLFLRIYLCLVILLFPFQLIHIILHEAGHLVFGLLTGYRFLSFRVFSLIIYRKDGKLHTRKFSIKGTAGQCLMYPPKKKPDGSFPYVLYNLGGGISNIIFSLPFLLPAITSKDYLVQFICYYFIAIGILTAATNMIPMSVGLQNDGMNLRCIRRSTLARDAFYLILKTNAEMSDGKRMEDYPADYFKLPSSEAATDSLTVSIEFLRYYQLLSFNDYEAAEQVITTMEKNSTRYISSILNLLELERLFFLVIHRKPIEEIAAYYKFSRIILNKARTQVSIQRINYLYETLLSEENRKDIMTLITGAPPKKWKELGQEKALQHFMEVAKHYPILGEAMLHIQICEHVKITY